MLPALMALQKIIGGAGKGLEVANEAPILPQATPAAPMMVAPVQDQVRDAFNRKLVEQARMPPGELSVEEDPLQKNKAKVI